MKKGCIVSLFGNADAKAYNNMQGEARAIMTFHVNSIKIIAANKTIENSTDENQPAKQGFRNKKTKTQPQEQTDDLPF